MIVVMAKRLRDLCVIWNVSKLIMCGVYVDHHTLMRGSAYVAFAGVVEEMCLLV